MKFLWEARRGGLGPAGWGCRPGSESLCWGLSGTLLPGQPPRTLKKTFCSKPSPISQLTEGPEQGKPDREGGIYLFFRSESLY